MANPYSITPLRSQTKSSSGVPVLLLTIEEYLFALHFGDADFPNGSITHAPAVVTAPSFISALHWAQSIFYQLSFVARHLIHGFSSNDFDEETRAHFVRNIELALSINGWDVDILLLFKFREALLLGSDLTKIKQCDKSTIGYVYLIRSISGHYKIGKTKEPQDRLRTFEVKLPFEIKFICLIPTPDMHDLERQLHQRFARRRVNGEWFQLSDWDIEFIKGLAL